MLFACYSRGLYFGLYLKHTPTMKVVRPEFQPSYAVLRIDGNSVPGSQVVACAPASSPSPKLPPGRVEKFDQMCTIRWRWLCLEARGAQTVTAVFSTQPPGENHKKLESSLDSFLYCRC